MSIVPNLFVLGGVALIAYWWANQGLFSAILHLLCVIVAGAIALAFWEPLMYKFLLRGNGFDNYAWGLSLILIFLVALMVLRVLMDKAIPANTRLPHWVNLAFGAPVGAASGILTMGIFIIAVGTLQTAKEPFGYSPWARSSRTAKIERTGNLLWIPVDKLTSEFYSLLSVTSLSTSTPLRHVNPNLWAQVSLMRDSFSKGKGMISLMPDAANITRAFYCPEQSTYAIQVHFKNEARDFGSQLTLSRAQIRLIGEAKGVSKPAVVHPDSWIQPNGGYFKFDDVSHYLTSQSGQQSLDVTIFFPAGTMPRVKYIQIRNTRYFISRIEEIDEGRLSDLKGGIELSSGAANPEPTITTGGSITSAMILSDNPRPIRAGKNMTLGTLELLDDRFFKGEHTFKGRMSRPPKELTIHGLYQPPGTRILQLEISRGGVADIYGPIVAQAGENAELMLVDAKNRTYWPMGYIFRTSDGTKLKLAPLKFLKTADDLPILSSSGTQTLKLLFIITENVTITRFQFGNVTVGSCNLLIVPDN